MSSIKGFFLRMLGYESEHARVVRAARRVYDISRLRTETPAIVSKFQLIPAQKYPHRIGFLGVNVWLYYSQLRELVAKQPQLLDNAKIVQQTIFDIMWEEEEYVLNKKFGVTSIMLTSRVSTLQKRFLGACLAYDKAIVDGELDKSVLSAALWRNLYGEEDIRANSPCLRELVKYVIAEKEAMRQLPDDDIISGFVLGATRGTDTKSETSSGAKGQSASSGGNDSGKVAA